MLCDRTRTHTRAYRLHTLGQVHCVAVKWEPRRVSSVMYLQPRCRLSEHFSQFLVQPLCYLAFKAAWRRHFGAIQARLLERAEYKRAGSSVSENNTAIPPPPPPLSQWPPLSPVTQLCYIQRLSLSDKWLPAVANALAYAGDSQDADPAILGGPQGGTTGF